jgi:TonB family protein
MILGFILRSLALAVPCALTVWLLRSRTAELRFLIWKCLLAGLFVLPVLMKDASAVPVTGALFLYSLVTVVLLWRLKYNLRTLHRVAARSRMIRDSGFRELSHELWLNSGAFLQPRVAESADISSPVTFDADDTWILLPPGWRLWSQSKLRAVLAHEMAHVRRDDAGTLFLASLATCLFWFNPLSWFLQRQLSALAEEACDEAVVSHESSPVEYANYLIDFASDVKLAGAIAITGNSRLKRRIERLFAETPNLYKGRKLISALAIMLFVPALYLAAAAGPQQAQTPPLWPRENVTALSGDDVAKLESDLQAKPDSLELRIELLAYYSAQGEEQPFAQHMIWFIHEHPDLETLTMAQGMFNMFGTLSQESRSRIQQAWNEAVASHPHSAPTLANAAEFVQTTNPERALALWRQAKALEPNKYSSQIASIYAAAETESLHPGAKLNNIQMSPDAEAALRTELASSRDPALLAATGYLLVSLSHAQAGDLQFQTGIDLIQRAISLDPGNKKWQDALQNAKEEPQRQANYKLLMAQPPLQQGTVRIGAKVAEASLITKTDPAYPPLALQAHIQGSVKFTITVGMDGKVQNLQLVSGHPLLVNAAKDAVLTYVYYPAKVDGKAVPFQTEVTVPFAVK